MNIKVEELTSRGYRLLNELGHQELVPFIRTYMKKWNKYSRFYYAANLVVFGLVGFLFVQGYQAADYNAGDRLTHFSYGIAIAFLLMPIHEYIHGLAYRSQGATQTTYGANLKKFYFMALADGFVANRKEFKIIALAPFVVLTTMMVLLLVLLPPPWTLIMAGSLLAHTAMCSGDFGLLSYFEFKKELDVVTYDDVAKQTSYFYGKEIDVRYLT